MNRLLCALVVCLLAIALAGTASAATTLTATLTNAAEPASPTTSAGAPRVSSGTATFVINDAMTSMTMTATIVGIDVNGTQTPNEPNDNLTAAHIHANATVLPPLTAGVVWGFFGSPFNDNNPNDFVLTPTPGGVGGTFVGKWDSPEGNGTTLATQLPNILAGHSYINFHTSQFGSGEIRGFLTVPEPSSIVLLGIGAIGLAGRAVLRRKARTEQ